MPLLSGTAKAQIDAMADWLASAKTAVVAIVTGPTGSGKTELWRQAFAGKRVAELSGLDDKLGKRLARIREALVAKSVAEHVGLSYNNKPEVVVVEDADAFAIKAAIAFAKLGLPARVACIVAPGIDLPISGPFVVVRMQRPPLALVAKDLVRLADEKGIGDFDLARAKRLAESCNCDLRQARLELEFGSGPCDAPRMGALEAVPKMFSDPLRYAGDADDAAAPIVAENYLKAKGLSIGRAAIVADAVSLGDTMPLRPSSSSSSLTTTTMCFFRTTLPCALAGAPLSSRPVAPYISYAGQKKPPCAYDLLQAIERRIVATLCASWAPPSAVAMEMRSLNMSTMSEWEAVRTLAPVGRPPIAVPPAKKEELARCLSAFATPKDSQNNRFDL